VSPGGRSGQEFLHGKARSGFRAPLLQQAGRALSRMRSEIRAGGCWPLNERASSVQVERTSRRPEPGRSFRTSLPRAARSLRGRERDASHGRRSAGAGGPGGHADLGHGPQLMDRHGKVLVSGDRAPARPGMRWRPRNSPWPGEPRTEATERKPRRNRAATPR